MYYSVSDFYKARFGEKVYKLSIDGGCTCPNRDGTKSEGGCIFCSEGGSGEFVVSAEDVFQSEKFSSNKKINSLSVQAQLEKAKQLVIAKMPKSKSQNNNSKTQSADKSRDFKFIAYFQNFTNTYGDFDLITSQFLEAVNSPEIVGIAIATRPDCLSDKMILFLSELSERTFVQLEFGLQTSNEKTAELINRCYPLSDYDNAMNRVKKIAPKIHIVTHIIFGLPNETESDMMATVLHAVDCKTDGIKITVLHVLKNTKLAELYEKGLFKILSMKEYFELISKALKIIPKNVVIHRLTGDGAKRLLIAPKWTADKKKVWNGLMKYLTARDK